MRTLSLLLLLGLALATPLEDARRLYAQGDMAGVLARLDPFLKGYDPPEEALLLAGFAQYRLGRPEEALFTFSRLVGTSKGGGEALYGFGLVLRALGDWEGARSALDWALRQGYRDAEEILKGMPPPPAPTPKARKNPPPFRAEKARFWIGEKPFQVRGVNLGVALPGRFPAEFPGEEALYRAWLELLSAMGANAIRTYTLLPPAFYRALLGHNRLHKDRPLYLFQGVWTELPEEEGYEDWEGPFLEKFLLEGREVLDALHGNLSRPPRPGHAHGDYTADVSPWVMGLLVGREFEPYSVEAYNRRHPGRTYRGRFLEASPKASPFEAYLAEVLDRLATYEQEAYGTLRPMGFVNWPTLDPLRWESEASHPEEYVIRRARGEKVEPPRPGPLHEEDTVTLDPTHLRPVPGSPVSLFAAYHVYPYYPDFLVNERDLAPNRYRNYLARLKAHHGEMPLLIAEFGLPSSRGIAHFHPEGLHHGGHSESEQAEKVLTLWQDIASLDLAGGMVFALMDEWFKRNWLFMEWEVPGRNPFWHNILDPEENYGLLAATAREAFRLDGKAGEWEGIPFLLQGDARFLKAHADPEYLWLLYRGPLPLRLYLDTVPGGVAVTEGFGAEFFLEVNAEGGRLLVEKGYYPFQELDHGLPGTEYLHFRGATRPGSGPFVPFLLEPNRRRTGRDGTDYPRIVYELGQLRRGLDPEGARDPMADFALGEDGLLEIRIPWGMLLIADPSQRLVWYAPEPLSIGGIGLWLPGTPPLTFTWPTWEEPAFTLRLKPLYFRLRESWRGGP
ncbi:tetratricopeptide repeat protein [Thermus sp.]|nr:tetratricopeptide repeat protein [Thermus sp.]